ncbi:MAG TPA: hypothetical protein VGI69_05480 [Gaiellaceae bacterium]
MPRGALQQCRGEERVTPTHTCVGGEIAVADACADAQSAVLGLLDPVVAQLLHVDEQGRRLDAEAHEVDEVRAAAEEHRLRLDRQRDRRGRIVGALVAERSHRLVSRIAATRFG